MFVLCVLTSVDELIYASVHAFTYVQNGMAPEAY